MPFKLIHRTSGAELMNLVKALQDVGCIPFSIYDCLVYQGEAKRLQFELYDKASWRGYSGIAVGQYRPVLEDFRDCLNGIFPQAELKVREHPVNIAPGDFMIVCRHGYMVSDYGAMVDTVTRFGGDTADINYIGNTVVDCVQAYLHPDAKSDAEILAWTLSTGTDGIISFPDWRTVSSTFRKKPIVEIEELPLLKRTR